MIDPHQMLRLRDMLDIEGIAYIRDDGAFGADSWRTASENFKADESGTGFGCVLNCMSYGHEAGLLEVWISGEPDPVGWLSAENVIERVRRTM